MILFANSRWEEKLAQKTVLDTVIVASHYLRKKASRLLRRTISRLVGTCCLTFFGLGTVRINLSNFLDTISANIIHAKLAISLVSKHACNIRLKLIGTIVAIRLLKYRLEGIVLLPNLNMLLLRCLIVEILGKNRR